MKVPKIDVIEMVRAIGEIKRSLDNTDDDFIRWVMRVGESRNILNNALLEFRTIKETMRELEHNIPQFHKQPGNFREFERHIDAITSVIGEVNRLLSYVQEPKQEKTLCDECGECLEEDEDDYGDE